jgi:flagellar hook-basal body complex protein FliE
MINPVFSVPLAPSMGGPPAFTDSPAASGAGFADLLNGALRGVSAAQSAAGSAEAGFASGVPGATLGKALVANDRAEVAWNATVAVRNEAVSAYQSIMSMQF